MQFLDTDQYQFSSTTRDAMTAVAEAADVAVREYIEPVTNMTVLVESSAHVLETGDNAATLAPDLIRWWFDPTVDVVQLATHHLAQAYAHEAFHATRFRRLLSEASARSWLDIAINEGLATTFARDAANAQEPWAIYDPNTVKAWCRELLGIDAATSTLGHWKFQHPDGRDWIAFRVGTWIIDTITKANGQTAADLVWTPAAAIAELGHHEGALHSPKPRCQKYS